ncbi:MAG: hypothetical protein J0I20_20290 [Chloroflexi bacterium]|nr:hypothetical protein [Chloroflexota bacterium]OJV99347.1 MAG: hypothetical protein BGO39_14020 [Chloroflexi bacterium 54-19]
MIWSAAISAFLASVVEFVEALTIVLVVGVTINWKSSLWGAVGAALTLAVLIGIFGTALVVFIPIEALRLIVGIVLVLFGLKWLKKAILRYSGHKALHDEEAIYEEEMRAMKARGETLPDKIDGFGFVTSYKSVLLEGLEVAFIVITFGTSSAPSDREKSSALLAAAVGAVLAGIVVVIIGALIRGPLTRIPENTLKFIVGIMLTSFGTFWGGEGLGIDWPGDDLFLLGLVLIYLLVSFALVAWLRTIPRYSKAGKSAANVGLDLIDPITPLGQEELQ